MLLPHVRPAQRCRQSILHMVGIEAPEMRLDRGHSRMPAQGSQLAPSGAAARLIRQDLDDLSHCASLPELLADPVVGRPSRIQRRAQRRERRRVKGLVVAERWPAAAVKVPPQPVDCELMPAVSSTNPEVRLDPEIRLAGLICGMRHMRTLRLCAATAPDAPEVTSGLQCWQGSVHPLHGLGRSRTARNVVVHLVGVK